MELRGHPLQSRVAWRVIEKTLNRQKEAKPSAKSRLSDAKTSPATQFFEAFFEVETVNEDGLALGNGIFEGKVIIVIIQRVQRVGFIQPRWCDLRVGPHR